MIKTLTLRSRRSNNMMEGVLQVSKSSRTETHSALLQPWQGIQESGQFDNHGAAGNFLSAQITAARLASSSSVSGHHSSDLLTPQLHILKSGGDHLSNDVSAFDRNETANILLPKPPIWDSWDSEYSWVQEGLSRSSGSMDESSLFSNDTLGSDTSRCLESNTKQGDPLIPPWPLSDSQSSSATATQSIASTQAPYQRRSWQSMSSDDSRASLGQLLLPNNLNVQSYSNTMLPSLSSSSSGLEASKFSMQSYLRGQRSVGSPEATSVYDSMARKIQNQMSGLEAIVSSGATTADMLSMGYPALPMGETRTGITESSDERMSSGMFSQTGLVQQPQQKIYTVSAMDHDKKYLTMNSREYFNNDSASSALDTNAIMASTTPSNQRFNHGGDGMNNSELLLESLSGNSSLNIFPVSQTALGPQSYLLSSQKRMDLESVRKWPTSTTTVITTTNAGGTAGAGTGTKDLITAGVNNSSFENLHGRLPLTGNFGDNEDNGQTLYDATSWPPVPTLLPGVGQQPQADTIMNIVPGNDSRKRFLHIDTGQPSNNFPHKRLHTETENGQTAVPSATLKRSSSWASSLTSTCSKGQDPVVTASDSLPCMKSSTRHAVGPALNTNLKPRARQGSANDPQSVAARHRRERISERLKVLQDLVPNGSKVDLVNMLEKATNYVKFLQLQLKVLTTDNYWPSNEMGAAPCTSLPNFEDMEGALKVLVAQAEKEGGLGGAHNSNATTTTNNSSSDATGNVETSPGAEEMESGSPRSSDYF